MIDLTVLSQSLSVPQPKSEEDLLLEKRLQLCNHLIKEKFNPSRLDDVSEEELLDLTLNLNESINKAEFWHTAGNTLMHALANAKRLTVSRHALF